MRGKGTWRVREIWESMGMAMLVSVIVSVVFLTALAAIDSDWKLPSSHLGNAGPFYLQKTVNHKAAELWNQYKKELLEISEDGPSYLDVRFPTPSQGNRSFIQSYYTLLAKRSLWDTVSYLFSREQHILHGLLKDDDVSGAGLIKYKDFLSTLSRVPRRSLRFKKYKRVDSESDQAHSPAPSPEHAAESPVSDQGSSEEAADVGSHSSDSSSSEPKSESEEEPNETPESLIAARKTKKAASSSSGNEDSSLIVVAVTGVTFAGLLIVVVIFLVCSVKEMDENDGPKDEKPLINVAPADIPAAAAEADSPENPENSENTENPGNNDSQSLPSVDNLPVATETETSSETNTMATEATEVAPVISQAALPLPPGKSPPPSPPTSPSPPPEPSKPPEPQSGPPEPQSGPPVPTEPPVPAGPPAPKPPTPNCPPPPKGARPPPPPKLGGGPKCAPPPGPNHKGHNSGSEGTEAGESPKAKLKPFFWDKVNASPNTSMVWHEIRGGSFQFNEDLMESLFGYSPADQNKNDRKKESAKASSQFIQIIDAKKAQNLAILLKALNVTTEEVCDALKEGNELPHELVQTLLKMAPTADEELKLRLYTGDIALLGPADRFLKILIEIPFAFKRMESLLFMSVLQEEVAYIKESFTTLEVACNELKNSRLFLKLLEAVLKTGNRMNTGTYRGGAQAIKLDTLLKLSDVKGTDGKTTLLHFVVQEIIRSEGLRAARALKESFSMTSVRTEDLVRDAPHDSVEYHRNLGLKVVSQLSDELKNVKKAAVIEGDNLTQTVAKLGHSLLKSKDFLSKDMSSLEGDEFGITLTSFVEHAEGEIPTLLQEEHRIMALVKSTGDYFHGKSGKDEGLRLFIIVRDFLVMLDKVCKEVEKEAKAQQQQVKAPKKETPSIPLPSSGSSQETQPPSSSQEPQQPSSSQEPEPQQPSSSQEPEQPSSSQEPQQPSSSQEPQPESMIDMRQRLFPAIQARQMDDDDFSSDDDSTD